MLRTIKNYLRRRQLKHRGIVPQLSLQKFTAGARSGVWSVCPNGLSADSIVYSFGVGDNLAWDLAMIERFGLTVHAFDPTPACLAWITGQNLPARFVFHPIGLAGHDGTLRAATPRSERDVNYRPVLHSSPHGDTVEIPVRRLATLMQQLGHERIDVLKMDIEGGEYAALADLVESRIPVRQLLVEFHHHFPGVGIEQTERAIAALQEVGFRIFDVSVRGLEMSLLCGN